MRASNRLEGEPVLAVCGLSGSGKTTVLELVIAELVGRGLCVGVVKHDAHGIDIDRPGKDSDRLYRAGAEVCLRARDETVWRVHGQTACSLETALFSLLSWCDIVLVEGHKSTPLPKVWLSGEGGSSPPPEVKNLVAVLAWDADRPARTLSIVDAKLTSAWCSRSLLGGLLIGGGSTRMGRPKQLIEHAGRFFAEVTHAAVAPHVEQVVLLGEGEAPSSLASLPRLPDPPGLVGPLAGLAGAFRWAPRSAWVITACDLPHLTTEAVDWLIERRAPGRRAILPTGPSGRIEPLLAVYEPHARAAVEELVARGEHAPRCLSGLPGVFSPEVPPHLARAWINVNHPADLEELGG